jgi:hypothetical protein
MSIKQVLSQISQELECRNEGDLAKKTKVLAKKDEFISLKAKIDRSIKKLDKQFNVILQKIEEGKPTAKKVTDLAMDVNDLAKQLKKFDKLGAKKEKASK